MARTDTLGNYLTDIADAIRDVEGSNSPIPADEFDLRIESFARPVYSPRIINFSNYQGTNLDYEVSHLDTSNLTSSFSHMFSGCSNLESLDLSEFDISGSTSFSYMFSNCSSLTSLVTPDFTNTPFVPNFNMDNMFYNCSSLTTLDLSSIHVNNPNLTIACHYTFQGCTSLEFLDLRNWHINSNTMVSGSGFLGTNSTNGVPADCLIVVPDTETKNRLLSNFNWLTNIKTESEYNPK